MKNTNTNQKINMRIFQELARSQGASRAQRASLIIKAQSQQTNKLTSERTNELTNEQTNCVT